MALISHLKVMISMDSANMHLASLTGTPVVSIWGATHYYAGFMGWGQHPENATEVSLSCRPCSIFGNKACFRKDYACLQRITPDMIVSKIEKIVYS
uniref:CAZy families GT9 protein n=2 Tax=Bacteroidales TaxID=171549 RepID=A0A060BZK3_9BACT|nr:CAZy families GT9 protein [uncultured Prevotella sp.]